MDRTTVDALNALGKALCGDSFEVKPGRTDAETIFEIAKGVEEKGGLPSGESDSGLKLPVIEIDGNSGAFSIECQITNWTYFDLLDLCHRTVSGDTRRSVLLRFPNTSGEPDIEVVATMNLINGSSNETWIMFSYIEGFRHTTGNQVDTGYSVITAQFNTELSGYFSRHEYTFE